MQKLINDLFNFSFKSLEKENPLAVIQQEGVYRLWNCLEENHIALLADEVGLGKTFQALALCALTWIEKPHARILVIAPNRSILSHWEQEYEIFCKSVYQHEDDILKTVLTSEIVNTSRIVTSLDALTKAVESGSDHLFLLSMHAFSTLHIEDDNENSSSNMHDSKNRNNPYEIKGIEYRKRLKKDLNDGENDGKFDLLVIDEAHYFRNKDGGANRVNTARGFFSYLAKKVLLMTATPNHTRETDIENIFSYFTDLLPEFYPESGHKQDEIKPNHHDYLDRFTLRRLKQLKIVDRNVNKYAYRKEQAVESHFEEEKKQQELFFALYQRQLARLTDHSGKSTRQFQLGYLEGLESTNHEKTKRNEDEQNGDKDYSQAPDSMILQRLVSLFEDKVPHPKMDKLVNVLVEDSRKLFNGEEKEREKGLVFVRRIPSVREITRRANTLMDKHFLEFFNKNLGIRLKTNNLSSDDIDEGLQEFHQDSLDQQEEGDDYISEDNTTEEVTDTYTDSQETYSEVFRMFIENRNVNKNSLRKSTEGFRFLQRMTSNNSLLSILFEPASDYKKSNYSLMNLYENKSNKAKKLYLDTVRAERQKIISDGGSENSSELIEQLYSTNKKNAYFEFNQERNMSGYPTIWSILYEYLTEEARKMYDDFSLPEKEAVARFFRKGILYASPVRIFLFTSYMKNYVKDKEELYSNIITELNSNETNTRKILLWYLQKTIEQFRNYYSHVSPTKKIEKLINRDWSEFNNTNPAVLCSGDVKESRRTSIIKAFNSPFYPDILVTTSVLQEGVSLHLNCRKIYHYGLPDNCGSWEQRVGRLDRNDSMIHRIYPKSEGEKLEIHYPYLKKTYDEDQLKFFIKKNNVARMLLDACGIADPSTEVNEYDYTMQVSDCIKTYEEYEDKGLIFPLKVDSEKKLEYTELPKSEKVKTSLRQIVGNVLGIDDNRLLSFPRKEVFVPLSEYGFYVQEDSRLMGVDLSYIAKISGLHEGCYYCLSLSISIGDAAERFFVDINGSDSIDDSDLYDFFYRFITEEGITVHMKYPAVQLCENPYVSDKMLVKYLLRVDIPVKQPFKNLNTMIDKGKRQLLDCYRFFKEIKENESSSNPTDYQFYTSYSPHRNQAKKILQWNFNYPFLRFSYDGSARDLTELRITYDTYTKCTSYDDLLEKWGEVARREIEEIEE